MRLPLYFVINAVGGNLGDPPRQPAIDREIIGRTLTLPKNDKSYLLPYPVSERMSDVLNKILRYA
jgi:hypothetical protein